jgi:hypothetical protein
MASLFWLMCLDVKYELKYVQAGCFICCRCPSLLFLGIYTAVSTARSPTGNVCEWTRNTSSGNWHVILRLIISAKITSWQKSVPVFCIKLNRNCRTTNPRFRFVISNDWSSVNYYNNAVVWGVTPCSLLEIKKCWWNVLLLISQPIKRHWYKQISWMSDLSCLFRRKISKS